VVFVVAAISAGVPNIPVAISFFSYLKK